MREGTVDPVMYSARTAQRGTSLVGERRRLEQSGRSLISRLRQMERRAIVSSARTRVFSHLTTSVSKGQMGGYLDGLAADRRHGLKAAAPVPALAAAASASLAAACWVEPPSHASFHLPLRAHVAQQRRALLR
jgi:hypothetical protein